MIFNSFFQLPGAEIMPETVELSVKEDQLRNMMSSMLVNQVQLDFLFIYLHIVQMEGAGRKKRQPRSEAALRTGLFRAWK